MNDWHIDVCSHISSQLTIFCKKTHQWKYNTVLSIWSLKQTTKFAMETANISTMQETYIKITNEDIAHHFLWYQEYSSMQIHSTRPNNQPSLLCGNTEVVIWSLLFMSYTYYMKIVIIFSIYLNPWVNFMQVETEKIKQLVIGLRQSGNCMYPFNVH
jgi:hypothetical protein